MGKVWCAAGQLFAMAMLVYASLGERCSDGPSQLDCSLVLGKSVRSTIRTTDAQIPKLKEHTAQSVVLQA